MCRRSGTSGGEKTDRTVKNFTHITFKALHPIDIVVSKIGRLNERDKEDIKDCIEKFDLTKEQITKRANKVEYVGAKEHYQTNLQAFKCIYSYKIR